MPESITVRGTKSISEVGESFRTLRQPMRYTAISNRAANVVPGTSTPTTYSFDFEEVGVGVIKNAYMHFTGLLFSQDGYAIKETMEGAVVHNGITLDEDSRFTVQDENIIDLTAPIVAASKFGSFNYSVFLHEILPSIYLASLNNDMCDIPITMSFARFFSADKRERVFELISKFMDRDRFMVLEQDKLYRVPVAYVLKPGAARQMPRIKRLMPSMMAELRMNFLAEAPSGGRKIYIHREAEAARSATNSAEVLEFVQSQGFEPVQLAKMTLTEQARLFSGADFVLAEHGAGLANLWYCGRATQVVELFPRPIANRTLYRDICMVLGLRYKSVVFDTPPDWVWNTDPMELPISALATGLS